LVEFLIDEDAENKPDQAAKDKAARDGKHEGQKGFKNGKEKGGDTPKVGKAVEFVLYPARRLRHYLSRFVSIIIWQPHFLHRNRAVPHSRMKGSALVREACKKSRAKNRFPKPPP
jgi:hypothetical protein